MILRAKFIYLYIYTKYNTYIVEEQFKRFLFENGRKGNCIRICGCCATLIVTSFVSFVVVFLGFEQLERWTK